MSFNKTFFITLFLQILCQFCTAVDHNPVILDESCEETDTKNKKTTTDEKITTSKEITDRNTFWHQFTDPMNESRERFKGQPIFKTSLKKDELWKMLNQNIAKNKQHMSNYGHEYAPFANRTTKKIKQIINCRTCKTFFDRYGDLVVIDENGNSKSVFFSSTFPDFFDPAAQAMKELIEKAQITHPLTDPSAGAEASSSSDKSGYHHLIWDQSFSYFDKDKSEEIKSTFDSLSKFIHNNSTDTLPVIVNAFEHSHTLFPKAANLSKESRREIEKMILLKEMLSKMMESEKQKNILLKWMVENPKETGIFHINNTVIGKLANAFNAKCSTNDHGFFTIHNGDKYPTTVLLEFLAEEVKKFNARTSEETYHVKTGLPSEVQLHQAEQELKPLTDSFNRRYLKKEEISEDTYIWKEKPMTAVSIQKVQDNSLFAGVQTKKNKQAASYISLKKLLALLSNAFKIEVTLEKEKTYPFSSLTTSTKPSSTSLFTHQVTENHTLSLNELPSNWNINEQQVSIEAIVKTPKNYWREKTDQIDSYLMLIKDCHRKTAHPLDINSTNLADDYKKQEKAIAQLSKDPKFDIKDRSTASGLVLSTQRLVRYLFTLTTKTGRSCQYQINE